MQKMAKQEDEFEFLLTSDVLLQPDLIIEEGYPVEDHEIVTNDGYILHMFRIPYGKKSPTTNKTRPPILFMHGLMDSSNGFVVLGAGKSLGESLDFLFLS